MADYTMRLRPRARRSLGQLDGPVRKAVMQAIDALADDPRPHGFKSLQGHRPYLRIRTGDYRVIYAVDDAAKVVTIAVVGNRREIYRNLSL